VTALPARAQTWSVALMVWQFPIVSETFVATLAASLAPRVGDLRLLATGGDIPPEPHHPIVAEERLLDRLSVARRSGRIDPRDMMRLARGAPPARRAFLAALAAADRVVGRERLALTRMLSRQPAFDVVHAQFGREGLAALRHRRMGMLRTRALVTHFRGYDITRFVRENGPRVYDRLFREGDGFIANCAHFRDRAVALGCPPERIAVIGSPIDTDRFAPPEAPRPDPGRRTLRLVAVGRLVEKKGFGDAVEAVARLGDIDVRLDILGEGPLRPELERRIAAAGLGGRVRLHGAATSDAVLAALHAADIALAPSVAAADGDGDAPVNTLKEAMATGLPVIATDHGGIPELVRPGENGALVPERDALALAAAIRALAARPHDWARLGAAGRAAVIRDYGIDPIARRTLAAYAAALDHARTRRGDRP
jgi:colanic acid/amylovoran biosynthesis glycosyltransferase